MTEPFRIERRVEFGETDMAGIMHFSNFFRYMEVAETAFLRSRGLSVALVHGPEKLGFPRVSASCDYLKPARFEDVIEVAVTLEKIGRKSLNFAFEFRCGGDLLAKGEITSVCCRKSESGGIESVEIPEELRAKLA